MRLLIIIALFANCTITSAQQRPYYTQYVLNTYIINPAVAGIENYTDIKVSHRHQWMGIDGAPITTYITIQGPVHKSTEKRESPTSFHPVGENPRGEQYWNDYTATDPHAGVGVTILNDKTGPLNRFSFTAAYAYHLPLTQKMSISGGISAGIQNMSLNTNKLYFGQNTGIDPAIAGTGTLHTWKPDINAGLWLYSAHFFTGIAAQNIVPASFAFDDDTVKKQSGRLVPHLFFTSGYRFLLTEDINFLPGIMIKYLQPGVVSYDFNAKCQYRDFLWIGASYRYKDGYAAMLGLNINNTFNISYAYDQTTSALKPVTGGSHEILIGFLIGNNWGDWCPRNVW
ncbi:type IX secretion system membrane protein PorP/SprF [Ilyomonas limi]|uniref:Type IX secretion system membrane protein PorP/SprF n=1 Tax=Ilyomonas limi TaxID=2575867 RepID=A0A4V5UUG4_9BACT|nr:type IX secretion system membrane protein PorP/SprF [Ilyomonas limi]TKK68973.1 type IX secretion system membrane protein PorP/SprF [Ilyomonas limi]